MCRRCLPGREPRRWPVRSRLVGDGVPPACGSGAPHSLAISSRRLRPVDSVEPSWILDASLFGRWHIHVLQSKASHCLGGLLAGATTQRVRPVSQRPSGRARVDISLHRKAKTCAAVVFHAAHYLHHAHECTALRTYEDTLQVSAKVRGGPVVRPQNFCGRCTRRPQSD